MQLLAILGRGIRQEPDGSWIPTRDLEMYGPNFTPIAKIHPTDDNKPNCLVGGGELNLLAGRALYVKHHKTLKIVVCAYGGRSMYLTTIDAPNESEIMSEYLTRSPLELGYPELVVWPRRHQAQSEKTNTAQELQNIFELAMERDCESVGIVTVLVHYARAVLMAQRHLMNHSFAHLKIQFFVSEDILLRHDPERFESRIKAMHSSKAFMRTMFFEQRGTNAILAGNY